MLALGFLLLIGTTLVAEAFGVHVPKGYIYSAMAFSVLVELLNMRGAPGAPQARGAEAGHSGKPRRLNRFLPDPFILALLATVALATLLPADGATATWVGYIATAAVVLLFFLHGVRLPRENLVAALLHWRLHLLILATTYVVLSAARRGAVLGFARRCCRPACGPGCCSCARCPPPCRPPSPTRRSPRATSPPAWPRPRPSNLLGIALTPLIAGLLLHTQGGEVPLSGIWKVVLQLLLPFVVGHALRPLAR